MSSQSFVPQSSNKDVSEVGIVTSPDGLELRLKKSVEDNNVLVTELNQVKNNLRNFRGALVNQVKEGLNSSVNSSQRNQELDQRS